MSKDKEDSNGGAIVTAVGGALLVGSAIFAAPALAVWGTWAVVNGLIVNEADKDKLRGKS